MERVSEVRRNKYKQKLRPTFDTLSRKGISDRIGAKAPCVCLSVACGATFPVGEGFCIRNARQQIHMESV